MKKSTNYPISLLMPTGLSLDCSEESGMVEPIREPESNSASEEAAAKSEKKMIVKRSLVIFLCTMLIGILIGFAVTSIIMTVNGSKEQDFNASYMTITLNRGFEKKSSAGVVAAFISGDVSIFVNRINPSDTSKTMSETEYAEMLIEHNQFTETEVEEDDGLCYFIAKQSDGAAQMLHYTYVYKTEDDFWLVEFAIKEGASSKKIDNISKWAHSVKFE